MVKDDNCHWPSRLHNWTRPGFLFTPKSTSRNIDSTIEEMTITFSVPFVRIGIGITTHVGLVARKGGASGAKPTQPHHQCYHYYTLCHLLFHCAQMSYNKKAFADKSIHLIEASLA